MLIVVSYRHFAKSTQYRIKLKILVSPIPNIQLYTRHSQKSKREIPPTISFNVQHGGDTRW